MRRFILFSAAPVLAILSGCATLRDTTLDHVLPRFDPPTVNLAAYRSVQERPQQNASLAVAAAISGGGHRAANFALGMLLGLEDLQQDGAITNGLSEIDYFSTVSGGGFTAGTYISALYDYRATHGHTRGFSLERSLQRHNGMPLHALRRDYQTTVLQAVFHPSLLGTLDSGDLMERSFDRYLVGTDTRPRGRSITLGDVFVAAGATQRVRYPYWIPNTTAYENGARVPFVPNVLSAYGVSGYVHDLRHRRTAGSAYSIPYAVGLKASASFPVVFPATTLTCRNADDPLNPHLHLLDGGLNDNLGIVTAFEVLRQDPAPRKVLILIDAYKGISHAASASAMSPSGAPVAYRIMRIALDGQHVRLERDIRQMAAYAAGNNSEPVTVITLEFDELRAEAERRVRDLEADVHALRRKQLAGTIQRARRELRDLIEQKRAVLEAATAELDLYRESRAVPTSLHITPRQQRLLIAAGRDVIRRHRGRIADALRPARPAPTGASGRTPRRDEVSSDTRNTAL